MTLHATTRESGNFATLNKTMSWFMTFSGPRLILSMMVVSWVTRISIGSWQRTDLFATVIIVALWALQEVLAHRYILHARPWAVGGHLVDIGRFHRDHHLDPTNLAKGFAPKMVVCLLPFVVLVLGWLFTTTWSTTLTITSVWLTLGLNYEWTHFYVHSPYKPRTWWGKMLKRNHLLHHFHNETLWWEVSTPGIVDRLIMKMRGFSFFANPREIPRSPTTHTIF